MITPNKFISFNESVLCKLNLILDEKEVVSVSDLYLRLADKFENIDQFLYALDVLYVLDKVDLISEEGIIINA